MKAYNKKRKPKHTTKVRYVYFFLVGWRPCYNYSKKFSYVDEFIFDTLKSIKSYSYLYKYLRLT